jgi:hypothetical protein
VSLEFVDACLAGVDCLPQRLGLIVLGLQKQLVVINYLGGGDTDTTHGHTDGEEEREEIRTH